MEKLVRTFKSWGGSRKPTPELSRSQYSLVSTAELSAGAVQLWVGLPNEVKYDPSLASLRQLYEKEHGGSRQYSLVSTAELSAGAVQLWVGLPNEVKYDPSLASLRQLYEKEHGKNESSGRRNGTSRPKRLPSVASAPHLNNNPVHINDVTFHTGCEVNDRSEKKMLEDSSSSRKKTKMAHAGHYIKMTLLLACWVFFTVAFMMYNEKETVVRHTYIAPGENKSYILQRSLPDQTSFLITLTGPFMTEQAERKQNSSEGHQLVAWLETWTFRDGVDPANGTEDDVVDFVASQSWSIHFLPTQTYDFTTGVPRSTELSATPGHALVLRVRSSAHSPSPLKLTHAARPLTRVACVLCACALLAGLYGLIIVEVINRTMAAVLVSTSSLAVLAMVGERPSLPEVISWLDVETLLLLFSMMLLVAIMAETGMFDFLAVFTFEVTRGKLWPLITLLCAITAVLSTVLDNVTTVLLMTPVTIRLCEVMDLDPVPILMSMVIFSNIGGTATPVGDPPNVIIASNKAVVQSGINFTNFTYHMTMGILLVCVQTYFQLRFIFRDTNKLRLNVPRDIQELKQQITIWRRAADSLPHFSKDEQVVRERLERKVQKLNCQLVTMVKESSKRACPKETFQSTLDEMKGKYKIRDKWLLIKATLAIGFVVTVFFLHALPEFNRVSLGWTALLGAILLLTLADREDLEPILHRVEWSTLLFFAALFVLMEALSKLGLIEFIGNLTEDLILKVDESARLAVAIVLMLWVSGVTSAFVDNIPLTTMMIRIVTSLGSNPNLNLPLAPLVWALSFGACLGGNGTLIGASANVVCAGVAEQHGYKFSFMQFFKIGFPVMIGHLIIASGYLLLCHCVFTWH